MWHAGMQIVLLSTHLTEIDRPQPRKQSGSLPVRLLFYPQHRIRTCRHYENGRAKICAHLCVCRCAPLHCTPGHCERYLGAWGGTQCESAVQMGCARGVCSWAGRAREVGQMQQESQAGRGGGKCEAVHMGGVVQGRLQYLVRRLPSGRRGWHLRAANQRVDTCAHPAGMSSLVICMDGMHPTA